MQLGERFYACRRSLSLCRLEKEYKQVGKGVYAAWIGSISSLENGFRFMQVGIGVYAAWIRCKRLGLCVSSLEKEDAE